MDPSNEPEVNQFGDASDSPPERRVNRRRTRFFLLLLGFASLLGVAVVGALALFLLVLAAPKPAADFGALPKRSYQADMAAFNDALSRFKTENRIPLVLNGELQEPSKEKEPNEVVESVELLAAEEELRKWCEEQFQSVQDGGKVPFDSEGFYAAILRSRYGKLSWGEKLDLRMWLENDLPIAQVEKTNRIVGVDFATDSTGKPNLDLAVVHFLSKAGMYTWAMQWFVLKVDGKWHVYDFQRLEDGRRISDEYAAYCLSPDEIAFGVNEVRNMLAEADDLLSTDEEAAIGKIRAAQQIPINRFDKEYAQVRIAWSLYSIGNDAEAFALLDSRQRTEHWGYQRALAFFALESDDKALFSKLEGVKQRLLVIAPDHPFTHWVMMREAELQADSAKSFKEENEASRTALSHQLTAWRLLGESKNLPESILPWEWLSTARNDPIAVQMIFDALSNEQLPVESWGAVPRLAIRFPAWGDALLRSWERLPDVPDYALCFARGFKCHHEQDYAAAAEQLQLVLDANPSKLGDLEFLQDTKELLVACAVESGDFSRLFTSQEAARENISRLLNLWWEENSLFRSKQTLLEEAPAEALLQALDSLPEIEQTKPDSQALIAILASEQGDHEKAAEYLGLCLSQVVSTEELEINDYAESEPPQLLKDASFVEQLHELQEESLLLAKQYRHLVDSFPNKIELWIDAAEQILAQEDAVALELLVGELNKRSEAAFVKLKETLAVEQLRDAGDALAAAKAYASLLADTLAVNSSDLKEKPVDLSSVIEFQSDRLSWLLVREGLYESDADWIAEPVLDVIAGDLIYKAKRVGNGQLLRRILQDVQVESALADQRNKLTHLVFEMAVRLGDKELVKAAIDVVEFDDLESHLKEIVFEDWAKQFFGKDPETTSRLIEQLLDEDERRKYEALLRIITSNGKLDPDLVDDWSEYEIAELLSSGLIASLYHRHPQAMQENVRKHGILNDRSWKDPQPFQIILLSSQAIELDQSAVMGFVRDANLSLDKIVSLSNVVGGQADKKSWVVCCADGSQLAIRQYRGAASSNGVTDAVAERLDANRQVLEVSALAADGGSLELCWKLAKQAVNEETAFIEFGDVLVDLSIDKEFLDTKKASSPYQLGTKFPLAPPVVEPELVVDRESRQVDLDAGRYSDLAESGIPVTMIYEHLIIEEQLKARVIATQPADYSVYRVVLEEPSQIDPALDSGVIVIADVEQLMARDAVRE